MPILRKTIYSILAFVVIVAIYPHVMNLFTSDIAPIDDKDLRTSEVAIEDNAYFDLVNALKTEISPSDVTLIDELDKNRANKDQVEALLKKYAAPLALFSSAAKKKQLNIPIGAATVHPVTEAMKDLNLPIIEPIHPIEVQVKFIQSLTKLIKLNAAIAKSMLANGQIKVGLERAFDGLSISTMMWRGQTSLLLATIGQAITSEHLKLIQDALGSSQMDSALLHEYASLLDALSRRGPDWIASKLKFEYQQFADSSLQLFFTSAPFFVSDFHKRPNKTKALMAEFVRTEMKAADQPCSAQAEHSNKDKAPADSSWFLTYITENGAGIQAFEGFAIFARSQLLILKRDQCELDREFAKTKALLTKDTR